MDSLTDVILHMNYTAREGGEMLRDAAQASARKKLPGDGWILIDLRKDYPDAWEKFRHAFGTGEADRRMTIKVTRKLFPFLPADPALRIAKLAVLFEMEEACEHACPEIRDCACAREEMHAQRLVEVTVGHAGEGREHRDDCGEVEIACVTDAAWPKLYHGVADVDIGPIDRCHQGHSLTLNVGRDTGKMARAFMLCRYETIGTCCESTRPASQKPCSC